MNQKKVKFNVIDILVLLVLLAGAVFLGVRMFGGQADTTVPTEGSAYQVTFRTECVPEEVAASLIRDCKTEAITALFPDSKTLPTDLGRLVDFTIGESIVYTTDSKGNVVKTTKPGYVSVTLVCQMTAQAQSAGLKVGQDLLHVGRELTVYFGMTQLWVRVQGIAPAV